MHDQYHLEQVSRSFAVSIQALSEPLKDYVGLAYLLCRVVDTIEDSNWNNQTDQAKAFETFESFLITKPLLESFENFRASFPLDLVREEKELIDDSHQLFQRYHQLPVEIRNCLQNPILSMSRGMKFFIFRDFKKLKLKSRLEVDQYCFFVAGVVGELLTNLANQISKSKTSAQVKDRSSQEPFSLVEAYHFALFLQKVNILKDKETDENSGRFLIPDRNSLWLQLENHSEFAFNYIEKIPKHLNDFKLFCSWALFLGLNALSDMVSSSEKSNQTKISREQAKQLFGQLKTMITDGISLKALYHQFRG
ncbi:MAG: squalene/phytoene synthase family protein, partial [Pseudobdellovibrionaceae bacterium]